ncbi:hypothetical protein [Sandaracinobacter neustonicus]|uniref:hypothetical protein n=1 Tax=Sandaracinobacter neustonicus TaxID=1715348 RepID=UPI0015E42CD3|nr:hypothetical protein [Sandaracinobacter neustonicus]
MTGKKQKPRYKNDVFESIHQTAAMLHEVGVVDSSTMAYFDQSRLISPSKLSKSQK